MHQGGNGKALADVQHKVEQELEDLRKQIEELKKTVSNPKIKELWGAVEWGQHRCVHLQCRERQSPADQAEARGRLEGPQQEARRRAAWPS